MLKVLDHLEEWLISILMGAATLIIFVAVAHRYASGMAIPGLQDWLLGLNFGWAQELCIIMFVWMAKFGAAYGVRTGIHVGVDVLINRLGDRTRAKFIIFGLLSGATFTLYTDAAPTGGTRGSEDLATAYTCTTVATGLCSISDSCRRCHSSAGGSPSTARSRAPCSGPSTTS